MDRIRVGVVGLGWVSQVVHLPILLKLPEAQLVAVCDRDRSKAKLVAEKFGIERVYSDVNQMLETEDLNAAIVCTSTDAHREVATTCMRAGKDVLVEKPIARTHAEAADMAAVARETKRKLMVGMNHRFRPDSMILKGFIEGEELGKIFYTRAGWLRKRSTAGAWGVQREKSGGGAFIDLGIAILDMALWMTGFPDIRRVSATQFYHRTKKVEDTSIVALTFKNGSRMHIEVSWSLAVDEDSYFYHVFGTDGSASVNPFRISKDLNGNVVNLTPTKIEHPHNMFKRSYENELRHFLGAVRNLHPVISTADEAVQRMRIVEAVYKSARLGKDIVLS
ncbi:MAG: putative dehydrogenase [Bacteroidetes bacterium]|nr:putative dehydrogenase [Bacteroidota bacterium]